MTYFQHILYILSRLQKHYNKYNAEHSIFLLCSSLNTISSEHAHSVAGFEEGRGHFVLQFFNFNLKKGVRSIMNTKLLQTKIIGILYLV